MRSATFAPFLALTVMLACSVRAGQYDQSNRYEMYTQKAAEGPHAKVVAATFFGTAGVEEFVASGGLGDGTVVAFGNAWGPEFPAASSTIVLGSGKHSGLPAVQKQKTKKGEKTSISYDNPDIAGFVVIYEPGLEAIRRVIRFDWGVASVETGKVTADGKSLILMGRCTPALRKIEKLALKTIPSDKKEAPKTYEGAASPNDAYVLKLNPSTGAIDWAWIIEGLNGATDQLWVDTNGAVFANLRGLYRIAPNGQEIKKLCDKVGDDTEGYRAVDPKDGTFYYGGDRNTRTNREPYRQPFLYKYDANGKKLWTLWEPNPKDIGSDKGHLESDSSVRALVFSKDGDLIMGGWSDGGNSVFPKQAQDWRKPANGAGFGMSPWGMKNANSLMHLVRVDAKSLETKAHTWFAAYIPTTFAEPKNRNAPNHISLRSLCVLEEGSVAFTGNAATGLIQTPNSFYKHPADGRKYGGEFVALFNPDFTNLRFSSYMPGCENLFVGSTRKGVAVVSRSRGDDGSDKPPVSKSPYIKGLQGFKGQYDGHLVLLELP